MYQYFFLILAKQYCIVWLYLIFLIHLLVEGGIWVVFLAIMNNAAINILI